MIKPLDESEKKKREKRQKDKDWQNSEDMKKIKRKLENEGHLEPRKNVTLKCIKNYIKENAQSKPTKEQLKKIKKDNATQQWKHFFGEFAPEPQVPADIFDP